MEKSSIGEKTNKMKESDYKLLIIFGFECIYEA